MIYIFIKSNLQRIIYDPWTMETTDNRDTRTYLFDSFLQLLVVSQPLSCLIYLSLLHNPRWFSLFIQGLIGYGNKKIISEAIVSWLWNLTFFEFYIILKKNWIYKLKEVRILTQNFWMIYCIYGDNLNNWKLYILVFNSHCYENSIFV